jgi:hypothetical protein
MIGTVLFKFKNARGDAEQVTFNGFHISAVELKNLIAQKKGLKDAVLELSDPKTKAVYGDDHVFPRGSAVTVRRMPAQTKVPRNQAAAAANAAQNAAEEVAGPAMATLQAITAAQAPGAVDATDEEGQLAQRKAGQGREDLQIAALVDAQNEAWRAQTDKNILQARAREQQMAMRGRGRGFGTAYRPGRGWGGQPTGFCRFCGKLGEHFSEDCPQKLAPRTDLRHVRAPAGIPSEMLEASADGSLLLNSGKTGALKGSSEQAAKEFAALPSALARRQPAAPALANAAHQDEDEQLQALLLEDSNQQQQDQQQQPQQEVAAANGSAAVDAVVADTNLASAAAAQDDYDDDFGFGRQTSMAATSALFDDDDDLAPPDGAAAGAATAAGGGLQLNLGMGMELPVPEAKPDVHDEEDDLTQQQQQQQQQREHPKSPPQANSSQQPPRSPLALSLQQPAQQPVQQKPVPGEYPPGGGAWTTGSTTAQVQQALLFLDPYS